MALPHMDELLRDFESEAQERLERLEELLLAAPSAAPGGVRELVDGVRRELHTLKGNAGMMGLGDLQAAAHAMEDLVGDLEARRPRLQRLLAALDSLRALLKTVLAGGAPGAVSTAGALGAAGTLGAAGAVGTAGAPGTAGEAAAAGAIGSLPTMGATGAMGAAGTADAAQPRGRAADAPPTAGPAAPSPPAVGTGTEPGSGVRIPFATLDSLVDLLAEMVIARGRLAVSLAHTRPLRRSGEEGRAAWSAADEAHERLEGVLEDLQQGVLRLRMVPLGSVFRQLGRIVHDTAAQEGKRVRLLVEGGDTAIDKALLELAGEALGHLVRNAIIHGIEEPAERRRAGKDESGTLRLAAHATAREVLIDVEDDGQGVQVDALRAAAVRTGAPPPRGEAAVAGAAATAGDAAGTGAASKAGDAVATGGAGGPGAGVAGADVLELLFLPGLSTRAHADVGAGRGIGLSAVKRAVERRGGQVEVASEAGRGSLFRLRLPLSASIARALLVRSDGSQYALPLRAVLESRRLDAGDLHEINGGGALRWRGQVIPALDLGCTFGTATLRRREGHAVIVEERGRTRALVVDQVLDIREVVVKTLDRLLAELPGVAGSTVLGDGSAVLVLDPASLVAMSPLLEEAAATPRALP